MYICDTVTYSQDSEQIHRSQKFPWVPLQPLPLAIPVLLPHPQVNTFLSVVHFLEFSTNGVHAHYAFFFAGLLSLSTVRESSRCCSNTSFVFIPE